MKKSRKARKIRKVGVPTRASGKVKGKAGIMPLGDRVLIKPLSAEEIGKVLASGIIIPETIDKTKPNQGIVVAVGTGRRNEKGERVAFDVKVGDRVYFTKPWDDPEKIHGVEYYFVKESDILAIIKTKGDTFQS
mgnify:CR=1 FL=1